MSINNISDARGARVGITEPFVLIYDGMVEYFGGRQEWFPADYRPRINKYGCGIIAAVNTYLYLAGINRTTRVDFMILVQEFLDMYPIAGPFLDLGFGVFPWQMSGFIRRKCRASGINIRVRWHGRRGVANLYEKMKDALDNNMPVIWAFYNLKPSHKIQFYKFIKGEYRDTYVDAQSMEHRYDGVNSHYVTVTAVYERVVNDKLERWVEISSWGSTYYVNYEQFERFVRNAGGFINPANYINKYCSNLLIVEKR